MSSTPAENAYTGAYPYLGTRNGVWREIARHVRRDAPEAKTVVELGAGYCDFINSFDAPRKIAYDLNPEMTRFAAPDVDLRIMDAVTLPGLDPGSVDLIFASNFLEHLGDDELATLMARCREALAPGGRVIVLQPNYRRCAAHYWDDPTHRKAFCDRTLGRFFERSGFRLVKLDPGLLPFSMKSRLPKWPILVRAYLAAPLRPGAAQMYAVAEVAP